MLQEYYEKHYKNGRLVECYPINFNKIGFIHKDYAKNEIDQRHMGDFPARLIAYLPKKIKSGLFGTVTWSDGIDQLFLSANNLDWLVETSTFKVNEVSQKTNWYDMPNNENGTIAKGIVNIDGITYAYGMVRSVFKYKGIKQWECITSQKNLYRDLDDKSGMLIGDIVGFSALDGFTGNDIYAGGNQGDCWHFNGVEWSKKDLPMNTDISTITCAPNGEVYITSRLGSVLIGRNDVWKIVDKYKQITHSAWFKGRIYFSSVNGRIYTHHEGDKELTEASFKTKYPDYMHHLIVGIASCEECLVIYTEIQAYAYDGENWHEIIEIPSLSKNA